MDPAERLAVPEEAHERRGRAHVVRLRAVLAAGSDRPRAAQIVLEFQTRSPEFVRMWEVGEVAQRYDDCETIIRPELGRIDVDGQILSTENRAQALVVLIARLGAESHSKFELLSVIGHQHLVR